MFNQKKYLSLLAKMESNNDYKIINAIGAIGKYQFTPGTLNYLQNAYNLPAWISSNNFRNSPELQEIYINAQIKDSLNFISSENLNKYLGTEVHGSKRFPLLVAKLNLSGMLAVAHLGGKGNLKKFLLENHNPNDGLTSLSDYAAYFSYYLKEIDSFFLMALAFIPGILLYYNK